MTVSRNDSDLFLDMVRELTVSVVQKAEFAWGGLVTRHALGRFAFNLVLAVNVSNSVRWHVGLGFPERNSTTFFASPEDNSKFGGLSNARTSVR